jgi:RNA polymerase sigma factor (sigma-70 family)
MAVKDFSKISNNFIKKNEWIIYYTLSKYPWVFRDDDLMQEAKIWLCEAKQTFNKDRSSWKTYASNHIKYRYLNFNRSLRTKGKSLELNGYSEVGLDVIIENDLLEVCNDIETINECIEKKLLYDSAIESIENKRAQEIVILYTLGLGPTEICKRYNITKQRVWQIYKEEMKQLKQYLEV